MDTIGRYKMTIATKHTLVVDSLLAAALTVLVWLQLALPRLAISGGPPVHRQPPDFLAQQPTVWAYVLVAICCMPLALRRRYPFSVLAASTVASAAFSWLSHAPACLMMLVNASCTIR